MSYIITTSGLSKQYKNVDAVDSVDLHVEEGAVYGLIGPFGSGKTTILKMLSGLAHPTAGSFSIGNEHIQNPRLGVLIDEPGLYASRTALQNMEIKRIAMNAPGSEETSKELLSFVGLANWAGVKCGSFSPGMRQRLSIALALSGDPDILILDEPATGLDPQGIRDIRTILLRVNQEQGKTILISGCEIDELSKIASVYGILEKGHLINEATEEEILKTMPGYIRFIVDDVAAARSVLESMGIFSYQTKTVHMIHVLEQFDRQHEMLEQMVQAGVQVHECTMIRDSLKQYYTGITGGGR